VRLKIVRARSDAPLSSSSLVTASAAIGWPLKLASAKPPASERAGFERAFKTLLALQLRCVCCCRSG
jgi:hypothetical protein